MKRENLIKMLEVLSQVPLLPVTHPQFEQLVNELITLKKDIEEDLNAYSKDSTNEGRI